MEAWRLLPPTEPQPQLALQERTQQVWRQPQPPQQSQRWAQPDPDAAVAAMQALVADPAPARAAAAAIAESIANRYAEPVVAKAFAEALA